MLRHLADSENPTISSGVQTLTNGKSDLLAISAASAVFPELGGPRVNQNINICTQRYYVEIVKIIPSINTETNPDDSTALACLINRSPSFKIELTGVPQTMIPRAKQCSSCSALAPNAYYKIENCQYVISN